MTGTLEVNILGWPSTIQSDGGPQFLGQFKAWCEHNNILHELSSPYNPKGNGLAEAAVKNVKHLLQKCSVTRESANKALYSWRNVPRSDGYSPAQLFFGRRQLTDLPVVQKQYEQCDFSAAKKAKDSSFLKSAEYYDIDKVNMPPFSPGQPVVIQHPKTGKWDSAGTIVGMRPDKHSYTVNCEGRIFIRSRSMLRASKESEVSLTASPEHFSSSSQPTCANPKTLLPGPLKTLGNHRPTTTGSLTNQPELHSCSLIGPPLAPGCRPSSSFASSWFSSTFATGGTRGPIRRQGEQSSMSSSCLPQETVPIETRNRSRLPRSTPPRFTRQRPSLTQCTRSSPTPSQVPSDRKPQSSPPLHSQLMGYNSPVSASRVSTTPCLLYTSPSPRDLSTSRMPSSA